MPRISPRTFALSLIAALLAAGPLAAQAVRGALVEADGSPVPGAMVLLLDAGGAVKGRVLTDASGRWQLAAPAAGTYRVRAERLGFEATVSEPMALAAGQTADVRLQTARVAVSLDSVLITARRGRSRCEVRPQEGTQTATLWGEVRKVLDATAYLEERRAFRFEAAEYVRDLDPADLTVRTEQRSPSPAVGPHPFRSLSAEDLAERGYVRETPQGTFFYAPDARALLSDAFLRDHCFRIQGAPADAPGRVGLAFEPVGARRLPEIAGTLWVDRATNELKLLEYRYANVDFGVSSSRLGGRVEFDRAPGGGWIVKRWWIRMPAVAVHEEVVKGAESATVNVVRQSRLAGIREQGGEVTVIRAGDGSPVAEVRRADLAGRVTEGGAPLAGATVFLSGTQWSATADAEGRFTLAGVPEGEYTLSFFHPRLAETGATPPTRRVSVTAAGAEPVELAFMAPAAAPASRRLAQDAERVDASRDSAVALAPIDARARGAFGGFYDRARRGGAGVYLTREDIERRRTTRAVDLFRTVPGLEVTREGVQLRGDRGHQESRCVPSLFVDGQPWPSESADLSGVLAEDIEGIEVYTRAALAPPRFQGERARCGVILVWLRSGAAR